MQNIVMYSTADTTLGTVRNYANASTLNAPTFTRGFPVMLRLRLFGTKDSQEPYPPGQLFSITAWQCVWDTDYNEQTTPVLAADNTEISLQSVTEEINGIEYTFTEIAIPVREMNTVELDALLGHQEAVSNLNMELIGFDGEGTEAFGLQIKGFTVRNRIHYSGTPTEMPAEYLTATEVRALVASGIVLQYSRDGVSWHDTHERGDAYLRVRSASSSTSEWSNPILILHGLDEAVTTIPASTAECSLSDGSVYCHAPSTAPIYTLPSVTNADYTHEIMITVDFSTVQTIAFLDSVGATIVPLDDLPIIAGDVVQYLCWYDKLQSKWCISAGYIKARS